MSKKTGEPAVKVSETLEHTNNPAQNSGKVLIILPDQMKQIEDFQRRSVTEQKKLVLDELRAYRNACSLSTACTIVLVAGMAIYSGMNQMTFACWLITACGLPLIALCTLFSRACSLAKKELIKMPEDFMVNRARTLTPSELAVRLINNNAQLLSDTFCLLDEDERDELDSDRKQYPTPENHKPVRKGINQDF